jgi:luciferase family oxidoreductase group 1
MTVRPLSLLDLTPIAPGQSAADALASAVELARLAERLGYRRVWYAEHHNTVGLAAGSPEVMIAHIAAHTDHIRVGSGGVMLPNHAPLAVAERYRLLEALHPGRIDLGLGRAPGTDPRTAGALRRTIQMANGDDQPDLLDELLAFDEGAFPPGHPWAGIRPVPVDSALPPIWLLGSSDYSARLAAEAGMSFAFAAHINLDSALPAMRDYRARFRPSSRNQRPHAILALSVTVGESREQAEELALIGDLVMLRLRTGQPLIYPSLEEAKAYPFTREQRMALEAMGTRAFLGDADTVLDAVEAFADECAADEIMLTTRLADPAHRQMMLRELARAAASRSGISPAAAD